MSLPFGNIDVIRFTLVPKPLEPGRQAFIVRSRPDDPNAEIRERVTYDPRAAIDTFVMFAAPRRNAEILIITPAAECGLAYFTHHGFGLPRGGSILPLRVVWHEYPDSADITVRRLVGEIVKGMMPRSIITPTHVQIGEGMVKLP